MDKLIPHITNSTSTSNTNWDLGMEADYHHHQQHQQQQQHHQQHQQTLHDHQINHLFSYPSIPTWPNYSPSTSSSPFVLQGPRIVKQMETLIEVREVDEEQQEVIRSSELKDEQEDEDEDEEEEELGAMKEMMYKIAAMQPVEIDPATIRKPKRRNVRISDDPQSVAARLRRERISEKIRILQRLVPGGTKLDTASMLEEAVRYVKFLKRQIRHLQHPPPPPPFRPPPTPVTVASTSVPTGDLIEGELPLCFSFNQGC